ncbi:MAG TPA: M67 family metallopeptidase, partial [Sphingomonadales bacterium]
MTERAPQHLLLPDRLRAEIIAHARETFPEECCGLLVGRRAADGALVAENTVRAANVAAERRQDRFELDPAVHLRVQRELRGSGLGVIGHYHSHPGG